jgi:hypothetical protein
MREKGVMTEQEFRKFLERAGELLEEHTHTWDIHGGPCYSCQYLLDDSFCTVFKEEKDEESLKEVHIEDECWAPGTWNGLSFAYSFAEEKVQEKADELYAIYKEEGVQNALEQVVEVWDMVLWLSKEKKEELLGILLQEYEKSKGI